MGSTTQEIRSLALTRIAGLLADRMPEPVLFCDACATVLVANASFEDATGIPRGEIMGVPLAETGLVPEETVASWVSRTTGTNGRGSREEVEIHTPSGNRFETVSVVPLRWGEAVGHAFCVVLEDGDLARPFPAYMISDACNAVRRYASRTAHDLRNPLTGISTGVQYLRRSLGPDSQHREALDAILEEIANLDNRIGRLAEIGRSREEMRPSEFDLGAILVRALDACRDALEERELDVSLCMDPLLPGIPGDGARMSESLSTVFRRAVAVAEERSLLRVRATIRPIFPPNGPPYTAPGWAVVDVLCQSTLENPRESLMALDPSSAHWESQAELYRAAQAIEAHHGSLAVSGRPGRHVRFTVMLPV